MNATLSSETLLAPAPAGLVLRSAVPAVDRVLRESDARAEDTDANVNRIVISWSRSVGLVDADFF